jgi:hypothetical protein
MTCYVDLGEQVHRDFRRALLRASLLRWKPRLRGNNRHERLLSFEEAESGWVRCRQAYLGIRTVEVERIVGSVGRSRDFDSSFLPIRLNMSGRWGRVDRAYHQGVELPAVSLYKIADAYFVVDGNHRVSVARYHKAAAINAEVLEIKGRPRAHVARPIPSDALHSACQAPIAA